MLKTQNSSRTGDYSIYCLSHLKSNPQIKDRSNGPWRLRGDWLRLNTAADQKKGIHHDVRITSAEQSPPKFSRASETQATDPRDACHRSADSHTYDKAAKKWDHFDVHAALAELSDDDEMVRTCILKRVNDMLHSSGRMLAKASSRHA